MIFRSESRYERFQCDASNDTGTEKITGQIHSYADSCHKAESPLITLSSIGLNCERQY